MASGDLSEMPLAYDPINQTDDDWRKVLFCMSLNVSQAPEPNTTPCALSRRLEIAQKEERSCQTAVWWLDVRPAAGNISLPAYLT